MLESSGSSWMVLSHRSMSLVQLGLPLVGLLSFAVLSYGYSWFYGQLGLDPSDTGLSYSGVIAGSWGACIVLVAAVAVGWGVGLVAGWIICEFSNASNRLPIVTSVIGMILAFFIPIVVGAFALGDRIDRLQDGYSVSSIQLRGMSLMDIRTEAVSPVWIESAATNPFQKRHRFQLVGSAGGTSLIYDVTSHRMIRVPTGAVQMSGPLPPVFCEGGALHTSC